MLLSHERLRRILGALWLLDGLLQLQPRMFTTDLIGGVMAPALQGQPAPVATSLHWIIQLAASHVVVTNLLIALAQLALGTSLLLGYRVNVALVASVVWSLVVWFAGEGMGMLFTGRATALTGAPGAVLLYGVLALALLPRRSLSKILTRPRPDGRAASWRTAHASVLSRDGLRTVLASFWFLAAALQTRPIWWQPGQIAQTVQGALSPGTLSGAVLDPTLRWLAGVTGGVEGPLNATLILTFLALAGGIAFAQTDARVRLVLGISIVLSLLFWWGGQALGMALTGLATDLNSGPLLIVLALCCWPQGQSAALRTASAPSLIHVPFHTRRAADTAAHP